MSDDKKNSSLSGDTKTELLAGEKPLHHYDGIVELDNPMPRWWLNLFYFGIVFGLIYTAYYELGNGRPIAQEFAAERAVLDANLAQSNKQGPSDDSLLAAFRDPSALKSGQKVYSARCASCHGAQGQGGIGPNLTDDYWIHGAKLAQIAKVVAEGVLDKGMPPWAAVLVGNELAEVTGYVKSLKGTNPPAPKAAQGVLTQD